MKVLVTLRDIEERQRPGGIGHYYKALRPYLGEGIRYFTIGSREGRRSWLGDARRLVADYWRFWKQLGEPMDLVNLNPSLGRCGLLRDGAALLLAKARGRKVVVFFRGWNAGTAAAIDRRWRRLFLSVFGMADGMIVLSSRFKEKLIAWGYAGPVWVETTTVDDGLLRSEGLPVETAEEKVNLLFLARVERDKGIYEAVDAFDAVSSPYRNLRLTVVGDGSELGAVRRYAEQRGITGIDFRGYLDGNEKRAAFREADIYLFPSTHGEGMPNSVLEAMAFGLPILTTAVGGLSEFFEDGEMGFVLDPTETGCLADRLERLIADPSGRRAIARANAEYAREHFLASRVAQRLRSIWECVLAAEEERGTRLTWVPAASNERCRDEGVPTRG